MKNTITVIEKEIGPVIEIEETVPMWKMPFVMKKDFLRIHEYVKSQGCELREAPYARYLDVDWEKEVSFGGLMNFFRMFTKKWHFQAGIPVNREIEGQGPLETRVLSNRKYVHTIHLGPYQNVGKTYKTMYAWIKNKNMDAGNESIEMYLNDPRTTQKDDLETALYIPVL